MRAAAILLAALLTAACTGLNREEEPADAAPSTEPSEDEVARDLQEIISRLELVREEYADAVRHGEIVDAAKYEASERFAEQAALRYREIADSVETRDAKVHQTVQSGLRDLTTLIAERESVDIAQGVVDTLLRQLAKVNPRNAALHGPCVD